MKSYKKIKFSYIFLIIGIISLTLGVTISFFNYTRTGGANTVRTGRISFTTSESNTINLTNVFPIKREDAGTDNTNSSEVLITITGDTTYSDGIEYLVTAEDVNIRTTSNKKVPIGIILTPEKTGELGESDNSYFTNRGGNNSIYKSFVGETDILEDGEYLLVGYIKSGAANVNGTIGIRAFIDTDKIGVSDTYDGTESDNMGTRRNWANGRVIFTTEEWNSFQTNGISFKIRVQANEGIWVGEPTSRNDLANIQSLIDSNVKSNITEINFIRMSEEMINTHADLIDLKNPNGQGLVKGWIEGTKLYIASPGETYFPEDCSYLLAYFYNVENIYFSNINTSAVTNMFDMFSYLSKLEYIDVSSFDTSSVTVMQGMFRECQSLTSINIDNFDLSNVDVTVNMFNGCTGITSLDLSHVQFGVNTKLTHMITYSGITYVNLSGNTIYSNLDGLFLNSNVETIDMNNLDASEVSSLANFFSGAHNLRVVNAKGMKFGTNVGGLFSNSYDSLVSLETVDLSYADGSNVIYMGGLFSGTTNLKSVNLSNTNFSSAINTSGMFSGCTGLETIDLSNVNFSSLTNAGSMFSGLSSLETINLKNTTFNSLTNTSGMFNGCSSLQSIDLSGLNTTNITTMTGMFSDCSSLTSLDLSSFDTSNVTNMVSMFNGCTSLKTIYVGSNWNTSNVSYSTDMFDDCTSLVGGNGTRYNSNNIDVTYAVIDTPGTPGYLTLKTS